MEKPPTLIMLDGEDLDEDYLEAPTFSPISTYEDNTSDHEYLCSIDPECADMTDYEDDAEGSAFEDLVIQFIIYVVGWQIVCQLFHIV